MSAVRPSRPPAFRKGLGVGFILDGLKGRTFNFSFASFLFIPFLFKPSSMYQKRLYFWAKLVHAKQRSVTQSEAR